MLKIILNLLGILRKKLLYRFKKKRNKNKENLKDFLKK